MLTGQPPFPGKDHKEIIKNILRKEPDYECEEITCLSEAAVNLIKKFLVKDPEKRISLEDAINDPWFKLPVSKISQKQIEKNNAKASEKMKA